MDQCPLLASIRPNRTLIPGGLIYRGRLTSLRRIRDTYHPGASELAFAYALRAEQRGYPRHSVARSNLDGANLTKWNIGATGSRRLNLQFLSLQRAALRGTTFTNVNLGGSRLNDSDLTRAEISESHLQRTRFDGADLTATVFRRCNLVDSTNANATIYRTQILLCELDSHPDWQAPEFLVAACSIDGSLAPIPSKPRDKKLTIYRGHTGPVHWATYLQNGRQLLTIDSDGAARIWDGRTSENVITLQTTGKIRTAIESPDKRHVLSIDTDHTARLWDTCTGEHLTRLNEPVETAAFRPDGRHILIIGTDGSAQILDRDTGIQIGTLIGHTTRTRSCAYSANSRYVIAIVGDRSRTPLEKTNWTVRIWEAQTGKQLSIYNLEDEARYCSFSPDGRFALVIESGHRLKTLEVDSHANLSLFLEHSIAASWATFSPDGQTVLAIGPDGTARTADAYTGEQMSAFVGKARSCNYSDDGRYILSVLDEDIMIWDTNTRLAEYPVDNIHSPRIKGSFGETDNDIVTTCSDGTAASWNLRTARLVSTFETPSESHRETAPLLNATKEAASQILDSYKGSVRYSVNSPDGTSILTIDAGGSVRIWNSHTGENLVKLDCHARSAHYSPDNKTIITYGSDASAAVWNSSTGERIATLTGHNGRVLSAAYAPNGRTVLTASADSTVRIWRVDGGIPIITLIGHGGEVNTGSYSPRGHKIITTSDDMTVRIWDSATGTELLRITALPLGNHIVHRGNRLVAASPDAWRYIGWSHIIDGVRSRLPAETFGPLPPLC